MIVPNLYWLFLVWSSSNIIVTTSATCSSACLNGGSCVTDDGSGESRCNCPASYIGVDCSQAIECNDDSQCFGNKTCQEYNGQRYCDCGDDATGFYCNMSVSKDLTVSTNGLLHYWGFNIILFGNRFIDKVSRIHFTRYGDARIYKSVDLGNVAKLDRDGSGALISATIKDPCLVNPVHCTEGLTVSFWLQYLSGEIVLRMGNAGFHVFVKAGKFFITYQGVDKSWTIERSCIPMGVFLVTATWKEADGLKYYENGKLVVSTNISDANQTPGYFDDVITVGYEKTSSGESFSSLLIDDLIIWKRALNSSEVEQLHKNGTSSSVGRASCLSTPCDSGTWCAQDYSANTRKCVQPTNQDCSFENSVCNGFGDVSAAITGIGNQNVFMGNMPYYDHTSGKCEDPTAKFLTFRQLPGGSLSSSISQFSGGQLFRLRFWFFIYGQDEGVLSASIKHASETLSIWNTTSRGVRNWQYKQFEMKVNSSFSANLVAFFAGPNLAIALDDLSLQVCDPNVQPNVTNVTAEDNGGVNITWSHGGCSLIFPFTTMVYYQTESTDETVNGSTNWTLLTNTNSTFHVISSILLYPNTTLTIKLNTRYVVNGDVVFSDDSAVFNFLIPDSFISSIIQVDAPGLPNSFRGLLVKRGTNLTATCQVASVIKPTLILKRDPILLWPVETLATFNNPRSEGKNLWKIDIDIPPFDKDVAGKYTCETKIGNKSVQHRELYLNIQGYFEAVATSSSSSEYIANFDSSFVFFLIGLGEAFDEFIFERKDWSTGQYVRSSARAGQGWTLQFFAVLFGVYDKCRCAHTGQHSFSVRTDGTSKRYLFPKTLRLKDPDPPTSVTVTYNGTSRAVVQWYSPGCNGGPVRAVRVSFYPNASNTPILFETNNTSWNASTGKGSFIVPQNEFALNIEYKWTVAVLYNYGDETIWSQESAAVSTKISDEIAVKISIQDGNSYVLPGNDGAYHIQLEQSIVLTCTVISSTPPQRTWNKRSYRGNESVISEEFHPEFSSSGFAWTSVINISKFEYADSGTYSCFGSAGNNEGADHATLYVYASVKVVQQSLMPLGAAYNSTYTAAMILQGFPIYNAEIQILNVRTGNYINFRGRKSEFTADGYLKLSAQYPSFMCSNTGPHLVAVEQADYSRSRFSFSSPFIITDPDPPKIISVTSESQSRVKLTWSAGLCNMLPPQQIYITVTDVISGTTLYQNTSSANNSYNTESGVGITMVEKGPEFSTTFKTQWIIRVSYPVWSQDSLSYYAVLSDNITISFKSNTSSSTATERRPVGYLLKRNETVTITCQILDTETSSTFLWYKKTIGEPSHLNNSNKRSWIEGEYLYGSITLYNFDYHDCGVYTCQINSGGMFQEGKIPLTVEAPIVVQHVENNLRSKVRRGRLKTIKVLFLGYPRPQIYAERLDHPDSSWMNYTDYLRVMSEDVYWRVKVERNLTCADTGLIRFVVLDENMKHFVNLVDRTPLIDPDPPSIVSVEYLSSTRAKITWKAKRCNFAGVKKLRIEQAGSGVVLSFNSTNWDNETGIGYQIVENITVIANETYYWNVSVIYGEGSDEATSQPSPLFEAVVVDTINECLQNSSCDVNAECIDKIGSYDCRCKPGFSGDGRLSCSNINECLNSPCHTNANCSDNEGSFECICNPGFSGNGVNCTNTDECLTKPCHANATCTDKESSYECRCNDGFSGNGFNCSNIDECRLSNPCNANANCTDNEGSYQCECNGGFSGNGFNCSNINECLTNPCDANANCTDNEGSYQCQCNDGFSGNGFNCSDIDECLNNPCDANASCTDNEGSYKCQCNDGFYGNGLNCSNINECLTDPCDANATCTDNEGSYQCECNGGFSGNGFNCFNIDECMTNPCDANATCTDNEGSYQCQCNGGFTGNGLNCFNIDECLTNPCYANATCTDNEGSYQCQCNAGFTGNGFNCSNIDECMTNPCDANATCTDNEGSYQCQCNGGFSGNGFNCSNIDECMTNPCDANATCTDNEGSYQCQCNGGFSGNGVNCSNMNECLTNPCDANATCTDNEGSYQCQCNGGFSGNGFNCSNIDECMTNPCDANATCIDNEGSYQCQCNGGFSGNGFNCSNINECLTNPCDANATCTDNEGSYQCQCNGGFSGNGFNCSNINECLANPCDANATCTDNEGSYQCQCNGGFSGNGFNCSNIDECMTNPCDANATCTDNEGSYQCQCNAGFSGNGFNCSNIDECVTNPCDANAICTDNEGSYKCGCNVGFSGNGFNCSNINECLTNPCHANATCTDNEGSYHCQCDGGFSGNGVKCSNMNECLTNPCDASATCTDNEGSYQCQCNGGFTGNGFNCSNINECLTNPCHANATCTDNEGSYQCQCDGGFSGNGVNCSNINECLTNPCHANATCTDSEGSYQCQCNGGFSGNGFHCSNIDECLTNPCHANATCTDNEGSYQCQCDGGFSGNGFNCSNINKCLANPCDANATCTDNEGSYQCQCNGGFSGNGFNCSNIDECMTNPCDANATCTDNEGSYQCQCNGGFTGNGFNCSNIDECLTNPCYANATCTDNEGSYQCQCNAGFTGNGFNCSNIDECMTNPCDANATCTDNEGSYQCQCNGGFSGNGFNCSNINECLTNPCDANATCTDNEGSYQCQCNGGFSGNGFNCSNINECLTNPCHANATCTDNEGSYQCQCDGGFSGNGVKCSNMNECLTNPCDANATCTDNEGSYQCQCNAGFTGNGFNCSNIDECMTNPCDANATCTDNEGSYQCQCNGGFSGNGFNCSNIDECMTNPCDANATCTDNEGSYQCQCNGGFTGNGFNCSNMNECLTNPCDANATCTDNEGSYQCQCNAGLSGNGFNCSNIDECLTNPCHANSTCTDNEGSYQCQCDGGFSGNGVNCSNMNECLTNPCDANATCTDNEGSYQCQCNAGFTGNGFNCSNIDECMTNPCDANATCTDNEGSYQCQCNGGFTGNGFNCSNMNECLTNPCDANATCTDNEGSYQCQCNAGLSGNGFNCSNIDECLTNPCDAYATCTDNEGSYKCRCNGGFSGNGFNCSNMNECLTNPCDANASCTDNEGSYECGCNVGFSGNGFNCSNIDECLADPCHANASCADNQGSYECLCNVGYTGDGISNCANIDECLKILCDANADCLDSHGSYTCRCKSGFSGNGTVCENIDECLTRPCDGNAKCTDSNGSYDCQCDLGYSGNGLNCSNVNECLTSKHVCHANADCFDNDGSYDCQCRAGYTGDGFNCSNIDECLTNPCDANATCTDNEGSYQCQCNGGFSGNGFNCSNIDECLTNPCDANATCTDNEGSYQCQCNDGFSGNGFNCSNIDECLTNPCDANATCTDNEGSYQCQCNDGFSGNGFNCSNIDECLINPCDTNATCTDNEGSYECRCNVGFSGNGFNCSNIDECLTNPCDANATCTDNEGSYQCQCNGGFSGNGFNCSNIDECLTDPCDANATCTDNEGSYQCQCSDGFSGDGLNCSNIDECKMDPCGRNANCTDNKGSYDCHCNNGYTGNGLNCSNIDECLTNACDANATCTDNEGSYQCECNGGFSGNGFNCSNINECLTNPCNANATCTDNEGSYQCQCNGGFSGNGFNCSNINECLTNPCDANSTCTDNEGSYQCQCNSGFSGNGFNCSNIDECLNNPCDANATCTDNEGSYQCQCRDGFSGDGLNCSNIDECKMDPCGRNANCTDNQGSYECHCNDGYTGNGLNCSNIDECSSDPCDVNAKCTDNPGSYECRCNDGYTGNGFTCTNINECSIGTACGAGGICIDSIGSYRCSCFQGYTGNGLNCSNIDECLNNPCDANASCTDNEGSYKCQCNGGFSGNGFNCSNIDECLTNPCDANASCTDNEGSYKCKCNAGFSGNGFNCSNIDECLNNPCDANATCTDNEGSYQCQCRDGFSGDGLNCSNIDECKMDPCDRNANCTDNQGSYECHCNGGYTGNGLNCSNIDECSSDPCDVNAKCTDNPGSYECRCNDGYTGNGFTCTNINECSIGTACGAGGICIDSIGSYRCSCFQGYTGNGLNCSNIDECLNNPCDANASCTDNEGSYKCQCNGGFSGNGFNCSNIDECLTNPCDANASCTDNEGSYKCKCNAGFSGNGFNCSNIDECLNNPCDANATCTDNEGSYQCQCRDGFSGDGLNCSNIDECKMDPCDRNANCTDNQGSYECHCNGGYTGNGLNCSNIDECSSNPCHVNAKCTDNPGSFECRCNDGYTGNGFTCTNIDECSTGTACGVGGICIDSIGSYRCSCFQGYTGVTFCEDIDECINNPDICPENSKCVNKQGSHSCDCNVGYGGSSSSCTILPDTFIDITFQLQNAVFTESLNDKNSEDYKILAQTVTRNFDAEYANTPEYRRANVLGFSKGSVICQVEIVMVPDSLEKINLILDDIVKTGNLGNLTVVPDSFNITTDIPALSNIKMEVKYSGEAGKLLEITCTVSGPSLPSFEWRHNDTILSLSDRVKIETNDKVSILSVRQTKKSDSGTYYCIVNKWRDTINSSVQIEVKVILVVEALPLSVAMTEGDPIKLTCNVTKGDEPNIQIKWFNSKQSGVIAESKELDLSGKKLSDPSFTAIYWCTANNSYRTSEKSNNVSVHISKALSDIKMEVKYSGEAGKLLEITCTVSGPSLPSFEWRHNDTILSLSDRVKIETNDKVSILSVRQTKKSDSGTYYCIVNKGKDTINSSVQIEVNIIPVVEALPLSVSMTEGDPIKLTCNVTEGDEPNIQIKWFNSKQSGVIAESKELDLSGKKLTDSEPSFTAVYWCTAKNSYRTSEKSNDVSVNIVSKDFDEFCFSDNKGGYNWEKTTVGTLVLKDCPEGTSGTVRRSCSNTNGKPVWGDVNQDNCRNNKVIDLLDKIILFDEGFKTDDISDIIQETTNVSNEDDLFVQDVEDIVDVLEKTKQKTQTQNDRENFIRSSSNIINPERKDVWKKVPSRNSLAKKIISGADLNAKNFVSQSGKTGEVVSYTTPNIDVRGIRLSAVKPDEPKDLYLMDTVGEGVVIPGNVTTNITQATVVKYSSIKEILSEDELEKSVDDSITSSDSLTIRSTVMSFTTEPRLPELLDEPFKIILQNNQTGYKNPKRTCAFTEPSVNNSKWSSEGCVLNEEESNERNVTCDCNHNSAFAIMMDVSGVEVTEEELKILETISTVGCSLSLLGIVLTALMQVCFWKQVKSPRAKVLLSLCVAIGFTDIFAILEGVARDSPNFCKAVAALLHYFVLSAFGWMLCEGILLYILLIRVFDGVRGKHWKIFNFIGWGIPLLIVVVSLGATQGEGYGSDSSCWLSIDNNLIWAFVGPAFLVILANTIVFVMVLRTMMRSHKVKSQDNITKVRTGVKAAVVIFPILGLTWVFGLMTFNRETLIFRYLFAVFNSAQGMLIFLFHCVLNKQMRDVVRNSTIRRSTFSTSFDKKTMKKAPKNSTSSPTKNSDSGINEKMVRQNARLQLESSNWTSESGGYNNFNVSVAEEMKENDDQNENNISPVQGDDEAGNSLSNVSEGRENPVERNNDAFETDSKGYHSAGSEEHSSSTDRPSSNEEAPLNV
ncbi:uncharacterized protein LOC114525371 isoform X2 [Dendronephthya gigantea]|uniref:uncharacterized protein LOC114525371 isoform X2 n=1 Tax=Dendronephthya gigantea TaxID=151771 RepID=UPI00106C0A75|nr:uncharacterized protein LOC114525371 isoform X2 [Dendronephthya gigantea]